MPLLLVVLLGSCSMDSGVNIPGFPSGGRLTETIPVQPDIVRLLDGIYTVIEGSDRMGKTVVVKASGNTLSIFTGKNAGLFVLHYGRIDSALIFEGSWRYTQGSETGLARFSMPTENGGISLLNGTRSATSFVLRGTIGDGSSEPSTPITVQFDRPLKAAPFAIIAHRGGGRNSDRLAESENSLGIIQLAEGFGANGIEIDVRLTSNGVPILFHDENFSPRLVNGEYCIGPVANYTFMQIRTLCTLKNGEVVPTLREALDVVLNKTTLSLVWLDCKSPAVLAAAGPLQQEYKQKAITQGRSLTILLGLSTEELVTEYTNMHFGGSTDALCELTLDDVRNTNARVWAPRWTLGPLPADAAQMRAEGRRTFVWTLDQREFILPFLQDGQIDGILTNYPSLVAFEYYVFQ